MENHCVHSSLGDNSCWEEGCHGDKDTKHCGEHDFAPVMLF